MNRDCIIILVFGDDNGLYIGFRRCNEEHLQAERTRFGPDVVWYGLFDDFWRALGKGLT